MGLHAPDAGGGQRFALAAVGVVKVSANAGEADLLARGHVGRAADHLHFLAAFAAGRHGTQAQAVGVRVRAHASDPADEHLAPAADFRHFPNLDPGHGQPVRQFGGGYVDVHVLPEPAKGDFHRMVNSKFRIVKIRAPRELSGYQSLAAVGTS